MDLLTAGLGKCSSAMGQAAALFSTPLAKATSNDRETCFAALKFFSGIAQIARPGATLVGRVAFVNFANYIDHFCTFGAVDALIKTSAKDSRAEVGKNASFAFASVGFTILLARDLGAIGLKRITHSVKHFTIFQITPLKPLAKFGFERICLIGLVAGYSFSLYQELRADYNGKVPSPTQRTLRIAYYSTAILAKTALAGAGILFPLSASTIVILTTISYGCEFAKELPRLAKEVAKELSK